MRLSQGIQSKKIILRQILCSVCCCDFRKKKLWALFLKLKILFNEEVYNSIIYCLRFDLSGSLKECSLFINRTPNIHCILRWLKGCIVSNVALMMCRSALEFDYPRNGLWPWGEKNKRFQKLGILAIPESWLKIRHWFFCVSFEMYYLSLFRKLYKMHLANTPKKPAHKRLWSLMNCKPHLLQTRVFLCKYLCL